MNDNNSKEVGEYFNKRWSLYQQTVRNNLLAHQEVIAELDKFLKQQHTEVSLADFGCGDSSAIAEVLKSNSIKHYIGIDVAPAPLAAAATVLELLNCKKQFICQDMAQAVKSIAGPLDIIFTSFALHHLQYEAKVEFISNCQKIIATNGYLLLVDVVKTMHESRADWLKRLDTRFTVLLPDMPLEYKEQFMQHPHDSDFPETIDAFRLIAQQQNWRDFAVLINHDDMVAFMVFKK